LELAPGLLWAFAALQSVDGAVEAPACSFPALALLPAIHLPLSLSQLPPHCSLCRHVPTHQGGAAAARQRLPQQPAAGSVVAVPAGL
jgi:hypothetical protein